MPAHVNLDHLFASLVTAARSNIERDGNLENVITGYRRDGHTCHVIEARADTAGVVATTPPILALPGPFQQQQNPIRQWLTAHKVATAAWVAEVWTYPPSDSGAEAARQYLAGVGPSPSQHPERVEAAVVFLTSPLAGYAKLAVLPIIRTGSHATLGDTIAHNDATDLFSYASSWLEECLPAPDDPK